jgi:hypothetical protein
MYRIFVVRDVDYPRLRRFVVEHNLSWTCQLFHPRIYKMYIDCLKVRPIILKLFLLMIILWLNNLILRDKYVVLIKFGNGGLR